MAEPKSMVELDAANAYQDAVGNHGVSAGDLDALKDELAAAHKNIKGRRGKDIGFMELPYDAGLVRRVNALARELRSWCRNFVVLGIGGSALGNIAVHRALNHPFHNLLPDDHPDRRGGPRIFVLDNVDPGLIGPFFEMIGEELDRTAFNVITKSGSTAETMGAFLHVRDLLRRAGLDASRHIVATTDPDPEKSLLRRIAEQDGYRTLPIPGNVGGRFSVLSAVGLLSAAVGGVRIGKMLRGAAAMDERCGSRSLKKNPALLYAALLYLHYRRGRPITVLMPYSSALASLGDWHCQLWAESLGKKDGLERKNVFVGPTPVAAVGVTDQHSVMQLFQDGPFDKVVTLLEVGRHLPRGRKLAICEGGAEEELGYLAGSSFNELFDAELAATRRALTDKGRPNLTLRIPRLDEAALGELFMLFQYAVSYSGQLLRVNAFNQPGVELGKQYTYGLMGREGYEPPEGLR